jgi:hypothetical protein
MCVIIITVIIIIIINIITTTIATITTLYIGLALSTIMISWVQISDGNNMVRLRLYPLLSAFCPLICHLHFSLCTLPSKGSFTLCSQTSLLTGQSWRVSKACSIYINCLVHFSLLSVGAAACTRGVQGQSAAARYRQHHQVLLETAYAIYKFLQLSRGEPSHIVEPPKETRARGGRRLDFNLDSGMRVFKYAKI